VEFARERRSHTFTGLDLAARELPPSGVGLAFGALGKQERTIRAAQDPHGHLDRGS
jgi:hypothetical protein